jgi:hypothetical protein
MPVTDDRRCPPDGGGATAAFHETDDGDGADGAGGSWPAATGSNP